MVQPAATRESGSIRTIDRAIDLLNALERAGHPIALSELGRATNMPKCTVLRLVAALERRGFVEKEQGRYQLGTGIVPLARAFLSGNSLVRAALPVLQELAMASGETASMWVRREFERMVVQHADSPNPLRFAASIGQCLPVHLGASGQILTAAMPEEARQQLLAQLGDIRLSTGEVLTKEQYLAKLERVRQQGFAVSVGERLAEVFSVAAPILKPGRGVVAAISLSGPLSRMTGEKVDRLTIELRNAARQIAEPFGRP